MVYNLYQLDAWVPHPDPEAAAMGCGGYERLQTPAENEGHALYVFLQRYPNVDKKDVKIKQL